MIRTKELVAIKQDYPQRMSLEKTTVENLFFFTLVVHSSCKLALYISKSFITPLKDPNFL